MIPSAFSRARCFSTALAVIPTFSARATAFNLPSSVSKPMIFSLLFCKDNVFSPYLLEFSSYFLGKLSNKCKRSFCIYRNIIWCRKGDAGRRIRLRCGPEAPPRGILQDNTRTREIDELRIWTLHSKVTYGESFGLHIYTSSTSEPICP